ncbi:DUF3859 domain-containing protein [Thalassotalea litorea]|uniref:DUF3859 domain-containing protein n=1 Tax=Thalassotalea litorea TaxID=2020715 RepID=A0A5R9IGL4_9GAMM|nr:prolyl oligopeptidase family serine peptidase [Thalassotalea litorea]TLU64674.1 DUF3859 domain-containing protein [Thalassotalea litorea]
MKAIIVLLLTAIISTSTWAVNPIPASKLFRNPEHISMQISPDGQYILSYDIRDDYRVLDLVEPITGKRSPLLKFNKHEKNLNINQYTWIDNKTVYVALRDFYGFIHIDFSKENPKGSWKKAKAEGYLIAPLADKPNQLLFAYNTGKRKKTKLIKTSPEQLETGNVENSIIFANPLKRGIHYAYDPKSKSLLSVTRDDEELEFWFLPPGAKSWRSYLTMEDETYFRPIGLLDENTFAVLTDKDQDKVSLVAFDIDTQTIGNILYQHPMYDLTGATLDEQGEGVKSVMYLDHGIARTEYIAAEQKQLAQKLKETFDGQNLTILDTSLNEDFKIVATFAADDPGTYYYYDAKNNKATLLHRKFLDLEDILFTSAKTFSVTTEDNIAIEAILTKPKKNSNGVLLVYPHGGPIGVRDTAAFNPEIQYLASRGYSILNVNFRGSKGFGKAFLNSGRGQFGQVIEQDITAVVNQVQQEHKFEHMCSIGASYGGYSAVMLAIAHPAQYECVVSLFGIYDLPLLFNATNYRTLEESRKEIRKVVGEQDESLKDVSPFYFAEQIHPPILLMAGTEDKRADFEQANRMKYRLQQLNKEVEYLFYKGVGHGHHVWEGDRHMFGFIDDFIRRKLDLPLPTGEHADKSYAEDFINIADGYTLDMATKKDFARAAHYYNLSAGLGENRAMFTIGSFYHQGKEYDKDINKAIDWYKKSSEHGYAEASYRLANLYQKGLVIERDVDQSFLYFQKALEQEHKFGELGIATAKCLGTGTEQDLDACFNTLFLLDKTDKEKRAFEKEFFEEIRSAVNFISHNNTFNQEQLKQFNQQIIDSYELKTTNLYLDDIEFGIYKAENREPLVTDEIAIEDRSFTSVPLKKGATFGARLTVDTDDDVERWARTMVKYKWTLPEAIKEHSEEKTLLLSVGHDASIRFVLAQDYEIIEGDWRLQIMTLDNKVLFDKTFTTIESKNVSAVAP